MNRPAADIIIYSKLRRFILLAAAAALLSYFAASEPLRAAADEPAAGAAAAEAPEKDPTRALLTGGQVLVGKMQVKALTIRTRYGDLTVPAEEIVKVRFRVRLSPEQTAELEGILKTVLDEDEELKNRTEALTGIEQLGPVAIRRLGESRKQIKNEELLKKVEELVSERREGEEELLFEDDEIVAERFSMRGDILEEKILFDCILGTLEIPRRDLLAVTRQELETKKSWKIDSRYTERGQFLDTAFKVEKGQSITLEATGSMNFQGNVYGPAGNPHHTWNNRPVGCLLWRIGDGPWEMFGTGFRGKARAAGPLHFCLHLYSAASGSFDITLTTKPD